MPEHKEEARSKKETKTEKGPSPGAAELETSAAATPEPHSDQELEDEEPVMDDFPELPENMEIPDEDFGVPEADNLPQADVHAAVGGNVVNPIVLLGRSEPLALPSGSNEVAFGGLGSSSGASADRPVSRSDIDEMLRVQALEMAQLNIANESVPAIDVANRPSFSGGPGRLRRGPEAVRRVDFPEGLAGGRIPVESEFFAPGPSQPFRVIVDNDQEMASPSTRRKRSPKLLDLVCEMCGGGFSAMKVPPPRPLEGSTVGGDDQPSENEPGAGAGADSDSGSSSSRASSPAICHNCLISSPARNYSNQSLSSAGSLSRAIDLQGAPNITISSSNRNDLPEYSTERVPSAPPPVYIPTSPSASPLRRPSSASYDPYSQNRRESDSLRYSYGLPGPSSSDSRYSLTSPVVRAGSSSQTPASVSPSSAPSSSHQTSPGRPGSRTQLVSPASQSGRSVNPQPQVSSGGRNLHSPESLAGQPSIGQIQQLLPSSSSSSLGFPLSPRHSSLAPLGLSFCSGLSPGERLRFDAIIGPTSVQPEPALLPPQSVLPGRQSDAAAMPPPASSPDSFWSGGGGGDRDLLASLGSPERREFSQSHGSGGSRRRSSGGSSGSSGRSASRSSVVSPGRVTPYGVRPSPRRRLLTGDGEAAEENVLLTPDIVIQHDSSGAGPSNSESEAGPR